MFTSMWICFCLFCGFCLPSNTGFSEDVFSFDDALYAKWSSWSECKDICKKYRERPCIPLAPKVRNPKCQYKLIKEARSCVDNENCKIGNSSNNLTILEVLPKKCGNSFINTSLQHKIVGGRAAKQFSWPWIVNLGFVLKGYVYVTCGATLISPNWAMTAAHCLRPYILPEFVPGELNTFFRKRVFVKIKNYHKNKVDREEYRIWISHIIVHPKYFENETETIYDFALLKLKKPVKSEKSMSFPCISNDKNFDLPKNTICYALGWGNQQSEDDDIPSPFDDRLQEVQLPLVDHEKCQYEYKNVDINYSVHVCAGTLRKDTCIGDSGGGLYCLHPIARKWMFYGVVSFGNSMGCGNTPGVYARISAVIDWIERVFTMYSNLD